MSHMSLSLRGTFAYIDNEKREVCLLCICRCSNVDQPMRWMLTPDGPVLVPDMPPMAFLEPPSIPPTSPNSPMLPPPIWGNWPIQAELSPHW